MPIKIQNRTNGLVLLRLNSGDMLHLAPRITSAEIMDAEVTGNPKVQKLLDRQVIALHKVVKKESLPTELKKEKAKSKKGKK